jgi:hypothetical protein
MIEKRYSTEQIYRAIAKADAISTLEDEKRLSDFRERFLGDNGETFDLTTACEIAKELETSVEHFSRVLRTEHFSPEEMRENIKQYRAIPSNGIVNREFKNRLTRKFLDHDPLRRLNVSSSKRGCDYEINFLEITLQEGRFFTRKIKDSFGTVTLKDTGYKEVYEDPNTLKGVNLVAKNPILLNAIGQELTSLVDEFAATSTSQSNYIHELKKGPKITYCYNPNGESSD